MIYYFWNAEQLKEAIGLVAEDLAICVCDNPTEADVQVHVTETKENILSVKLHGKSAEITYGGGITRFLRALAVLVSWVVTGKTNETLTERPLFTTNGAMIDMSRNAVMNVPTVKLMLRKMALMGMNMFMLYTEDTYEVTERPYFGYMRGRYTKAELREIDRYALALGVELIPCIQMLGHLATALRWKAANAYKDTANVLMVGAEETYAFLEDLLRSISETFTSRRVHIGMDETHDLGTGRSLDKNGYIERSELYLAHLKTVSEMTERFGLKPIMWSDMFFRLAGKDLENFIDYDPRVQLSEDVKSRVPLNIGQVFWDYYQDNEAFYAVNIEKHQQLCNEVWFAGGVWGWSGPCFWFSRSRRNTIPALEACRKKGVKQVIATVWHNGSESNLIMSLAGLAWYADYDYTGRFDEDSVRACFARAVGERYDDFLLTEQPELLPGGKAPVTRMMLYNDPLVGLADAQFVGVDCGNYYQKVSSMLCDVKPNQACFKPAFAVIRKLSELLENKSDFGIRLKAAYDNGDRQALANLAAECDTIIQKTDALIAAHKTAWMHYNKPFGWEVHDIRYGGIRARFITTKERVLAYLSGEAERLEELEEERLRLDGNPIGTVPFGAAWYKYDFIATAGRL